MIQICKRIFFSRILWGKESFKKMVQLYNGDESDVLKWPNLFFESFSITLINRGKKL